MGVTNKKSSRMYSTRAFRAATSMGSAGVVVLRVATSGTIQAPRRNSRPFRALFLQTDHIRKRGAPFSAPQAPTRGAELATVHDTPPSAALDSSRGRVRRRLPRPAPIALLLARSGRVRSPRTRRRWLLSPPRTRRPRAKGARARLGVPSRLRGGPRRGARGWRLRLRPRHQHASRARWRGRRGDVFRPHPRPRGRQGWQERRVLDQPQDGATVDSPSPCAWASRATRLPSGGGTAGGHGHHHIVVDDPKGYVEKGETIPSTPPTCTTGRPRRRPPSSSSPGRTPSPSSSPTPTTPPSAKSSPRPSPPPPPSDREKTSSHRGRAEKIASRRVIHLIVSSCRRVVPRRSPSRHPPRAFSSSFAVVSALAQPRSRGRRSSRPSPLRVRLEFRHSHAQRRLGRLGRGDVRLEREQS